MSLEEEIKPLIENLWYPSESDEPVAFITLMTTDTALPLTDQQLHTLLELDPQMPVQQKEPEKFWSPVVTIEEWYDETEKERTRRFLQLRTHLETHLNNMQYFEVGKIEVDAYVIGQSQQGQIQGVKTMIVRT